MWMLLAELHLSRISTHMNHLEFIGPSELAVHAGIYKAVQGHLQYYRGAAERAVPAATIPAFLIKSLLFMISISL